MCGGLRERERWHLCLVKEVQMEPYFLFFEFDVYKYNIIQQFFGVDIRFLVEMRDAFMIQVLVKNNDSIVWSKSVKLKTLLPIALVY